MLTRVTKATAIAATCIVLAGCPLQEVLETLSNVHVEVLDASSGEPIVDASVELNGELLVTDADGMVTFTGVVSGEYTINVTAEGYEPESVTVSLTTDGVTVTVELMPVT